MYINPKREEKHPKMSEKSSTGALEALISFARTVSDVDAAVDVIHKAIESPLVYSFSEILDVPFIKSMKQDPQYGQYYRLLELFAYGTYQDYLGEWGGRRRRDGVAADVAIQSSRVRIPS